MVSLPVILFLLDGWPLRPGFSRRTVIEKIPFIALSLAACVVTFIAQRAGGAVRSLEKIGLLSRVENSFESWLIYPWKTVWPSGLAVYYPFPEAISAWALLCGAAILGISIAAVVYRQRAGWFTTGWFWYLASTLPVIGLVQVGDQAWANRYMYIPMVGLTISLIWGCAQLMQRRTAAVWGVAVLGALTVAAWREAGYWRNSETLFKRDIAVTGGNYVAWESLGDFYAASSPGRLPEAIRAFEAGVGFRPKSAAAHTSLAGALHMTGDMAGAQRELGTALRLDPEYAPAHEIRGNILFHDGKTAEAIAEYRAAVREAPSAGAHSNLGAALLAAGKLPEAMTENEEAIRLDPDMLNAHYNLGSIYLRMAEPEEAVPEFRAALKIDPNHARSYYMLGQALLATGHMVEAISQMEMAVELDPRQADARAALAGLLANTGSRK